MEKDNDKKKIAVIGAGASGLAAIYCCREEGFDVACFEKTSYLGGLWNYKEDDVDGQASVMKSTVMNTSKEMSAYSTFPPPKEFPNYMHHSVTLRYFELYAEKYDLEKYIKYKHEVIKADRSKDFESSGKWVLKVKNIENGRIFEETFDGVTVCTGHHVQPLIPNYPGQEHFKGQILHSHSYKTSTGFENKKVVVVGAGNSGCDAAVELGSVSQKVYLSTRKGCWIQSRLASSGIPNDATLLRRFVITLQSFLPFGVACSYLEGKVNAVMDHELYRMKPNHRILNQHPTINDMLPSRIISGLVTVKGDIERFTPNGVVFVDNENEVCEVDAVIMATGYKIVFPFLDDDICQIKDNRFDLYKFVFPPTLQKPTLAFIGLVQPNGPIFPAAEMHSRWFMAILSNRVQLPSQVKMLKDINNTKEQMRKRFVESPRHTMEADWIPHLDEIASIIGVKPNLLWLAIRDPKLWYAVYFGPMLPYHYRLNGRGAWPGARNAILTANERMNRPFETRKLAEKRKDKKCRNVKYCIAMLILIALPVAAAYYYANDKLLSFQNE